MTLGWQVLVAGFVTISTSGSSNTGHGYKDIPDPVRPEDPRRSE